MVVYRYSWEIAIFRRPGEQLETIQIEAHKWGKVQAEDVVEDATECIAEFLVKFIADHWHAGGVTGPPGG
jgi:hypothetical protein